MTDVARRVIEITPDQIIGPARRRKRRRPNMAPEPLWSAPVMTFDLPPNGPRQDGFGALDKIAQEMKT